MSHLRIRTLTPISTSLRHVYTSTRLISHRPYSTRIPSILYFGQQRPQHVTEQQREVLLRTLRPNYTAMARFYSVKVETDKDEIGAQESQSSGSQSGQHDQKQDKESRNGTESSFFQRFRFHILFTLSSLAFVMYITSESFLRLCINTMISNTIRTHRKREDTQWRLIEIEYDRVQGCLMCGGMKFDNLRGKLSRRIRDDLGVTTAVMEQEFKLGDVVMKLPFILVLKSWWNKKEPLRVPFLGISNGEVFYHVHLYHRKTSIPPPTKDREFPWVIENVRLENFTYSYAKVLHQGDKKKPIQNFSIVFKESRNFSNVRSDKFIFDTLFRMKSSGWILPYIRSDLHVGEKNDVEEEHQFLQTHDVHEDEQDITNTTISHVWDFTSAPLSVMFSALPSNMGRFSGQMRWTESIENLHLDIAMDVQLVGRDSWVGKVVDFTLTQLGSDDWQGKWQSFRVDKSLDFDKAKIMNAEQYQEEVLERVAKVISEEISKHSSKLKEINWGYWTAGLGLGGNREESIDADDEKEKTHSSTAQ